MHATVSGPTLPLRKGASPKFSMSTASKPAAARARASRATPSRSSARVRAARGAPGSAGR
jgi:hypothetical protein